MRLLAVLLLVLGTVTGATAKADAAEPAFHDLWRADRHTGFGGWALHGVRVADGRLTLDGSSRDGGSAVEGLPVPAGAGGLALGPVRVPSGPFRELIPSWNAETRSK